MMHLTSKDVEFLQDWINRTSDRFGASEVSLLELAPFSPTGISRDVVLSLLADRCGWELVINHSTRRAIFARPMLLELWALQAADYRREHPILENTNV